MHTAKTNASTHHFTTVSYSADGTSVIAGGNSRWVCLYDVASRVLLQRFEICRNTSVDGVRDMLNSKNIGEAGPRDLIDDPDDDRSARAAPAADRPVADRSFADLSQTFRAPSYVRGPAHHAESARLNFGSPTIVRP